MDQWLESHVQHHPDIAAELAWLRSTSGLLQSQAQADAQSARARELSEAGLGQLMQRIAQEQTGAARTAAPTSAPTSALTSALTSTVPAASLRDRLLAWLSGLLGAPGGRSPALAFGMAAVVLVQAGVIAALLLNPPAQQVLLGGPPGEPDTGVAAGAGKVVLTVAFRPQATEQALRELLAGAQAQIVSGPSALGLYTIAVPAAQADSALARLRGAAALVESVQR